MAPLKTYKARARGAALGAVKDTRITREQNGRGRGRGNGVKRPQCLSAREVAANAKERPIVIEDDSDREDGGGESDNGDEDWSGSGSGESVEELEQEHALPAWPSLPRPPGRSAADAVSRACRGFTAVSVDFGFCLSFLFHLNSLRPLHPLCLLFSFFFFFCSFLPFDM